MSDTDPPPAVPNKLREKDRAVLTAIDAGAGDVHSVKERLKNRQGDSTLSNAEINWAVSKLADHDLITVQSFPDERIIREVDGQRRSFDRPKEVGLTPKGEKVANVVEDGMGVFEPMDRSDLIQTVQLLDQRMADLEDKVEAQRRQLLHKLKEITED